MRTGRRIATNSLPNSAQVRVYRSLTRQSNYTGRRRNRSSPLPGPNDTICGVTRRIGPLCWGLTPSCAFPLDRNFFCRTVKIFLDGRRRPRGHPSAPSPAALRRDQARDLGPDADAAGDLPMHVSSDDPDTGPDRPNIPGESDNVKVALPARFPPGRAVELVYWKAPKATPAPAAGPGACDLCP